jgi:DNA gyrase subunit A
VQPGTELLVVTENGYGKRTAIEEYPVKGRGTMGVKTIGLTEKKGGLAGALIVREHHDLVFISQNGMVQRTDVRGISKQGRPAQGVRVMNLRDDDQVSAVALVMETSADTAAQVEGDLEGPVDGGVVDPEAVAGAEGEPMDAADDVELGGELDADEELEDNEGLDADEADADDES